MSLEFDIILFLKIRNKKFFFTIFSSNCCHEEIESRQYLLENY